MRADEAGKKVGYPGRMPSNLKHDKLASADACGGIALVDKIADAEVSYGGRREGRTWNHAAAPEEDYHRANFMRHDSEFV